jgi:FkbM family methyltransferase
MHTLRSISAKPLRRDVKYALKQARKQPVYPLEFRAQFGEDALIWLLTGAPLNGFFIEAGAFDGYNASVTYALECIGWRGLLVEPNPVRAEECRTRRIGSRVVQAALGAASGETTFVITDDKTRGMFSHVPDGSGKRKTVPHAGTITVPLTTLDELLRDQETDIDAVSLDVEGLELAVLRGFDVARHRPKLLLVEDNPRRPSALLAGHMDALPYVQLLWLRVNRVYARIDLAAVMTERLEMLLQRSLAVHEAPPPQSSI